MHTSTLHIRVAQSARAADHIAGIELAAIFARRCMGVGHYVSCAQVIMQSYACPSDLWSVGMVTYQLLSGRFPFVDNIRNCSLQDVWKAILTESGRMEKHLDKLDGMATQEAKDFLRCLLQRDPAARWSATQALQHPVRAQRIRANPPSQHCVAPCLQARTCPPQACSVAPQEECVRCSCARIHARCPASAA